MYRMTLRIEVLGELKVWDGDRMCAVTAEKQRTILAVLIAARGLGVSVDRLLESVWGSSQPSNGRSALRYHISKLRSKIQRDVSPADSVIQTTATGYRLKETRLSVDAWTLQDRVDGEQPAAVAHKEIRGETGFPGPPGDPVRGVLEYVLGVYGAVPLGVEWNNGETRTHRIVNTTRGSQGHIRPCS
jgi:DNA-binding winged helix-turn-helix (wHTH) protein